MRRLGALLLMAAWEIRSHLGRSLLTGTSLLIGILSIISVQVVGSVVQESMIRSAELAQGRHGSVVTTVDADPRTRQLLTTLTRHDFTGHALLTAGDTGTHVSATDGTSLKVVPYLGSLQAVYPLGVATPLQDGEVLLNQQAASHVTEGAPLSLLRPGDPLPVTVHPVAAVEDEEQEPTIYVPMDTLPVLATGTQLRLQLSPAVDEQLATQTVAYRLASTAGASSQFVRVDVLTLIRAQLDLLRAAFLVTGLLTLGVGVLGIVNIGLATLGTRAVELSLRRSLGASRLDVAVLVLLDSVIVGLVGALLSLAIAVIAFRPTMLALIPTNPPGFPLSAAAIAIAAGLLAGVFGGLAPAVRAARLPISAAMRA